MHARRHIEYETRAEVDADHPNADFAHEPFAAALWAHLVWGSPIDQRPTAAELAQFRRAMRFDGCQVLSVKLPAAQAGNKRGTRFRVLWSLRDIYDEARPPTRTWTQGDSLSEYLDERTSHR